MSIGYVIVNDLHPRGPTICNEEYVVHRDRLAAEKEARQLRREHKNDSIKVYELAEPGIIYILSEEDVFDVAKDKRISRKKVKQKMGVIREIVENGFYNWHDIIEDAIDTAIEDR